MTEETLDREELLEAWPVLSPTERLEGFSLLPRVEAEDLFFALSSRDQLDLLLLIPAEQRRSWLRLLPPDDVADLLQEAEPEDLQRLAALLDAPTRAEVNGLLAYAEDEAGGLMNPRFARIRPEFTVDQAVSYLRKRARRFGESLTYVYVVDDDGTLLGVVSFRDLLQGSGLQQVTEIMKSELTSFPEDMDQELLARTFTQSGLLAIPVVDAAGRMKGVVTADDVVDVVTEEATEDIQKIGGTEALDGPYLGVPLLQMIQKRGGWLAALFLGEMLTATAMGFFENEIAQAVVLALFVPLIISSGGNSGSQASTLVIRAMALGEIRLRDWWRVIRRELASGLALGLLLGAIGITRILVWEALFHTYGEHYLLVGLTVGLSLIGVVLFGTVTGSMLPLLLRKLGFDPASASAPFVATLVDVTGLVIYFTVASFVLAGTLL